MSAGSLLGATLACSGLPEAQPDESLDATAVAVGHCVERDDGERCGLLSIDGTWVVAPRFEATPERPDGSFVATDVGGALVVVDRSKPTVRLVPTTLSGRATAVREGVFAAWPDGPREPAKLFDLDGQPIATPPLGKVEFDRVTPRHARASFAVGSSSGRGLAFDGGLMPFCDAQKRPTCGFLRPDGAVAFEHPRAQPLVGGAGFLGRQLVDPSGTVLRDHIIGKTPFWDGLAWAQIDVTQDDTGEFDGDWAVVRPDGTVAATLGDAVVGSPQPFSEGRSAIRHADRGLVLVAADGSLVDTPAGTTVLNSVFDGRALYALAEDGPFGYLAGDGSVAIEPRFQAPQTDGEADAMNFAEGLAAVRLDGRWGYVDPDGKLAIEPRYDRAGGFQDGLARVQVEGRWFWIRTDGTELEPTPSR